MIDAAGLRARGRLLAALRGWFAEHGYLEVPTPTLVVSPAMEEHLYALEVAGEGSLRTSPEFALKRVLAGGLHRVYELGPCYRGREHGPWHRTEFLMLEWYRANAHPADVMDEVESLVGDAARALGVAPPETWRRVSMRELFLERGLDPWRMRADELVAGEQRWDDAMLNRWVTDIEPRLEGAVFVTDWPASQAALARVRRDVEPPVAERFELYIDGLELANGFFELVDAEEQARRFTEAALARKEAGEAPHPDDPLFVEAVGRMPATTGIAMGVDRLLAVLMGWEDLSPGRVER